MQVFVSEFITSGALCGQPLPESLLREGQAMLSAIVGGMRSVIAWEVATTLDRRLGDLMWPVQGSLQVERIDSVEAEQAAFDRLVRESDVTLVIAPETDGILLRRVQRVQDLGARSLNCLPSAIELCGDKLKLSRHLKLLGIPTIETYTMPPDGRECWDLVGDSCVVKPRDGAGSWLTFGIANRDSEQWNRVVQEFASAGALDRAIVQPWVPGRARSVGCLCRDDGTIDVFPTAVQHLGENFQYLGGRIQSDTAPAIRDLVRSACQSIPGLLGYVGFDLLVPIREDQPALIVEINPRLTTSYVGYQQQCLENVADQFLRTVSDFRYGYKADLRWKKGTISFQADGEIYSDFHSDD